MKRTVDDARALLAQGKTAEAVELLEHLSVDRRGDAKAQHLLGLAYLKVDRFAPAATLFRRLSDGAPSHVEHAVLAATALMRGGDETGALAVLERLVGHAPNSPIGWVEFSVILRRAGQNERAIEAAQRAVSLAPGELPPHSALGNALVAAQRWPAAVASFERAVELAHALGNRRSEATAQYNRAQALLDSDRLVDAEAAYRASIALVPDMTDAHWGLGRLLLLSGRYDEGWREHEWRLRSQFQRVRMELTARPRWSGERLGGRTLLVWREQGHGDFIQFMRFLPMIEKDGGKLVVETRPGLCRLVETLGCVDEVLDGEGPLPAFDLQIPIMSLGSIFAPSIERLSGAPYLGATPHPSLPVQPGVRRIAFTYAGNPANNFDPKRSLTAAAFQPILETPGIKFVALQIGERAQELASLPGRLAVEDARPHVGDFADTASVLRSCDMLITACTSTAHLGGALGVPTWVLLWKVPDWRWLLDRDDSPWYRSIRLFRQKEIGAWAPVIENVRTALMASLSQRGS